MDHAEMIKVSVIITVRVKALLVHGYQLMQKRKYKTSSY
jgi:hypothetical protein